MGRSEARPALLRLLLETPSAAVIDALSAVADEECLVILGRIARTRPDLTDAAPAALESIGWSRAAIIAAATRALIGITSGAGVPDNLHSRMTGSGAPSASPSYAGTGGSNPLPSSGESCKPSVPLSAMNSVLPRSVTA